MRKEMEHFILRGTISNMETGESSEVEHFLFPNEARISAIVQVKKVESYVHPDDSMQVSVSCQALDCIGGVFPMLLNFTPETVELQDGILAGLQPDLLFNISGEYTAGSGDIEVHNAEYRPLEEELAEFAAEAFRVNSGKSEG